MEKKQELNDEMLGNVNGGAADSLTAKQLREGTVPSDLIPPESFTGQVPFPADPTAKIPDEKDCCPPW